MKKRIRLFLINQKYRFDLGYQFLALFNFLLLILSVSDKIMSKVGISKTWIFVLLMVAIGFFGMWLFGFFLDKVVKYSQGYSIEIGKRNPLWHEQQEFYRTFTKELKEIREILDETSHR